MNDSNLIRDKNEFCSLLQSLKFGSSFGIRDRMVFLMSVTTGLDVDTVLNLKVSDVFTSTGKVRKYINVKDEKNKIRTCSTIWIQADLVAYKMWLDHIIKRVKSILIYNRPKYSAHKFVNGRRTNKYDFWMFTNANLLESLDYRTYQDIIDRAVKVSQIEKEIWIEDIRYIGAFIVFAGDFDSVIKGSYGQLKYNDRADLAMYFLGNHQNNCIDIDQSSYMNYIRSITAFNI